MGATPSAGRTLDLGNTITLSVHGLDGLICVVKVEQCWKIYAVKERISQKTGIGPKEQQLVFDTRLLFDSDTCETFLDSGQTEISLTLIRRSHNRAVWLEKVKRNWQALRNAPEDILSSPEHALCAMQQDILAHELIAPSLLEDRDFVLNALRLKALDLRHVPIELRGDLDVVSVAVEQDIAALFYATPELRADPEFVRSVVIKQGGALKYAADELRGDPQFCLGIVRENGLALSGVMNELKSDREVAMQAVMQNRAASRFVAPELLDRDFMAEAVKDDIVAVALLHGYYS